jgi:hypothetical protein
MFAVRLDYRSGSGLYIERAVLVEIVRRLGLTPQERGSLTNTSCPDIFELADGSFAVIGTDKTEALEPKLPAGASRADYERIVVITRDTLIGARKDIPER